jgi:hypothetical protein
MAAATEIPAATGATVDPFAADMSVQAEVRDLAGAVLATYSRLDVRSTTWRFWRIGR